MAKKSSPVKLTARAEFVESISEVAGYTVSELATRELVLAFNKCDYGRTSSVNIEFVGSPARCPIRFTYLDQYSTDISINGRKPRGRKLDKLRDAVVRLLADPEVRKAYEVNHHGHWSTATVVLSPPPEKPSSSKVRQCATDTNGKRKVGTASTDDKRKIKIDCSCGERYTLRLTDAEIEDMEYEVACRECDKPHFI